MRHNVYLNNCSNQVRRKSYIRKRHRRSTRIPLPVSARPIEKSSSRLTPFAAPRDIPLQADSPEVLQYHVSAAEEFHGAMSGLIEDKAAHFFLVSKKVVFLIAIGRTGDNGFINLRLAFDYWHTVEC